MNNQATQCSAGELLTRTGSAAVEQTEHLEELRTQPIPERLGGGLTQIPGRHR